MSKSEFQNKEAGNQQTSPEISNRGDHYQFISTNTNSGVEMSVVPLRDWRTGKLLNNALEIHFEVNSESAHTLDSSDLQMLSLPQDTTSKQFMEIFGEKYGSRWKNLQYAPFLSPDEIFEKLFPEVFEARRKTDEIARAEVLAKHGIK